MGENHVLIIFTALPLVSGVVLFWRARRRFKRRPRPARPGWASLVAGNLLVLFFLLSLALLAGEVYLRFFYDTTDSISSTLASHRWFSRHWVLNHNHFRDNEDYAPALTPGKRRITFLGDSFTAGQGIKNMQDRFVNRLRARHSEWEIHMLADLGWDTDNELELLKHATASGYQLDSVALVYCLNDVGDLLPEWKTALKEVYEDFHRAGWLVRNSYAVNLLYHRWKLLRNPYTRDYYAFIGQGYQGPVWQQQQQQLRALRALVESHGGKLLVVTFPFLHALGPNYPYQAIHRQLDDFWQKEQVPHLDLLPIYQGQPPARLTVNRHDAHPNEYAHQLATEAIEKFLAQNPGAIKPGQ